MILVDVIWRVIVSPCRERPDKHRRASVLLCWEISYPELGSRVSQSGYILVGLLELSVYIPQHPLKLNSCTPYTVKSHKQCETCERQRIHYFDYLIRVSSRLV